MRAVHAQWRRQKLGRCCWARALLALGSSARRVVITTKDSKQLDNQIWPAIEAHKAKFPDYRFIEREVHTPEGGFIIGFTTDDAGRAEGWHKVDDFTGPLLVIADESKSITEDISRRSTDAPTTRFCCSQPRA